MFTALLPTACSALLSYTPQDHLPKGWSHPQWAVPSHIHHDQDNAPQTMLSLIEAFHQPRFLLPRCVGCVKLTETNPYLDWLLHFVCLSLSSLTMFVILLLVSLSESSSRLFSIGVITVGFVFFFFEELCYFGFSYCFYFCVGIYTSGVC